jgi:hypothetical protein
VAESSAWEAVVGRKMLLHTRQRWHQASGDIEFEMQQIVWPLSNWRNMAVKAALEGQDIEPSGFQQRR